MATATNKVQCFVCNKEKNTYNCKGCSKEFCFPHLTEHRQSINTQLEAIINDHDQFQQTIIQQKQNLHNSSLIRQINQWEKNSIHHIQQTAQLCRKTAMKLTQKSISDVEKKFIELSKKLKEIREENEFNENDLKHFQLKLTQITEEFLQPLDISIRQDLQEFISKISVNISSFETKLNKWKQKASTVAGGNGHGLELNQLHHPRGIFIDEKNNIFTADFFNHRVVEWKCNAKEGQIIAGENGRENRMNELNYPTHMIVDQQNHSIIIADCGNRRVIRWMNQNQQILIENIYCCGLAMDKYGFLYVSDWKRNEVRRWKMEEYNNEGIIVAGGNGLGNQLNQLNCPNFIFVDDDQSVYVSDFNNDRVIKWRKDAKDGKVVAGGNGQGRNLNQLSCPQGVIVDDLDQIYVADSVNNRVMRWSEGKEEGEVVVGEKGKGNQPNQLNCPFGLSFDNEGNLYVVDCWNHRIEKFKIIL
ncbi:unnamed protein product [Adineta steineri]|uniref:Uncharacterized protein n=1 Tax=Adineta steineri TaxID=433720 RepID=A0A814I7F3_9BILA|nr:unnamed protein product [Adineta steineri]CAF1112724.1 unnamed protein product [Adineta steineri]